MLKKFGYAVFIILTTSLFMKSFAQQLFKGVEQAYYSSIFLEGNSGPRDLNWINNGRYFSYISINDSKGHKEIRSFNPVNLQNKLILDTQNLSFPGTQKPFSFKSFRWAKDSKHILFKTNFRKIYRNSGISDYYIYSLQTGGLKIGAKDARTAELSPDGSMTGFERNGNIFIYDFGSQKETRLTDDAGGNIFNGHYDWVYEEEFDQTQAWNWSPDSKYIAYWQFDESGVPVLKLTDFEGHHPAYEDIPIPLVGDKNPKVRIGVVNIKNDTKIWLNPEETGDYYIPRIYWTSEPNKLAMVVLNRAQNLLKLYFFNVITGNRKLILKESSKTWISVSNSYTNVNDMLVFPPKIKEFFWISDRNGWYNIYRYNYDGKLMNQVTNGHCDVNNVAGVNIRDKKIYFTAFAPLPVDENLYSINFNGSGKIRLSNVDGYHRINMSPNTEFYLDSYSNVSLPKQVELWKTGVKMIKKLEDNKDVSEYINQFAYSHKELFSFITSDSVRLDCSMIKPFKFDSTKKYPVILSIYGGPESHEVYNSFCVSGWNQFLAQNGYIIVDINNRGNTGYGKVFEKIVYGQLGKWESYDFAETAKYLSTLPYVAPGNIAIMGTSYGGYSSVYTMLTHPGVFKLGIANSPVTDWRLYDDIYTERYMGLITKNKAGYLKSSAIRYAANLKGRLLLIHSLMDDNVHIANTMQLLTALTNAGKDADLRIYPLGAHGAYYSNISHILLYKVYYRYLNHYLKGVCGKTPINSQEE